MLRTLSSVCLFDSSSFLGLASCFGATSFPQSKLSAGDVDFGALDISGHCPQQTSQRTKAQLAFCLVFAFVFAPVLEEQTSACKHCLKQSSAHDPFIQFVRLEGLVVGGRGNNFRCTNHHHVFCHFHSGGF